MECKLNIIYVYYIDLNCFNILLINSMTHSFRQIQMYEVYLSQTESLRKLARLPFKEITHRFKQFQAILYRELYVYTFLIIASWRLIFFEKSERTVHFKSKKDSTPSNIYIWIPWRSFAILTKKYSNIRI